MNKWTAKGIRHSVLNFNSRSNATFSEILASQPQAAATAESSAAGAHAICSASLCALSVTNSAVSRAGRGNRRPAPRRARWASDPASARRALPRTAVDAANEADIRGVVVLLGNRVMAPPRPCFAQRSMGLHAIDRLSAWQ